MLVDFDQMHNTRDLGGIAAGEGRVIVSGRLFRGDQPFRASDADKRKLFDMGIRKVIDLRSIAEHDENPDPVIEGIENVYLPVIEDVGAGVGIARGKEGNKGILQLLLSGADVDVAFVDDHMRSMYRTFITDPFANGQYARFIDEVIATAQAGGATLWHCTGGKDRAGFATVVILEALGSAYDDIVADYLRTNEYLAGVSAQLTSIFFEKLPNEVSRQALERFFMADPSYLEAAYETVASEHGTFDAFLETALKVDSEKRALLQRLFLT